MSAEVTGAGCTSGLTVDAVVTVVLHGSQKRLDIIVARAVALEWSCDYIKASALGDGQANARDGE